jgi:ribosome-binding ATPase YchF (GTP1/OBG family)
MKIGIVGYQGAGKSTLFAWLTGIAADPASAHSGQLAAVEVPDDRVLQLCEIYQPKKVTLASLELVDTPGLDPNHEGNAGRLSLIREAGCLLHVVDAFSAHDPLAQLTSFAEDLLLADLEIVNRRVEKLRESVKKPRPSREQEQAELAALGPVLERLEAGRPLAELELSEAQQKATRSFQLLTEKPQFVIFNLGDDADEAKKLLAALPDGVAGAAFSVGLSAELAEMDASDRAEFAAEMGGVTAERGPLLRRLMEVSGQILFFTVGDKEVRTWMVRRGCTAAEAAGGIHTDFERGFVRAETMTCEDLFRLGSEREVKAENLMRREPRDYVVCEGDILLILANA